MAAFALASTLPLRLRAHRATTARSAAAPSVARVRMAASDDSGSSFDFDAIARKLAADLAAQGIAASTMPDGRADGFEAGAGPLEVTIGNGEMPKVILRHASSSQEVEIYTYGAAVTSWKARGDENLWMSDLNKWEDGGKAIRGGIPICFPQFGAYGSLVAHGFARVSVWSIIDTFVAEDESVSAVFGLDSDMGATQPEIAKWPHKFSASYTVTLSNAGLETNLQVTNTGDKPFDFTMAFHNYIATSDVGDARIFGYEGVKYLDRLDGDKLCPPEEDTGAGLMLERETDRIYIDAPEELAMFDFASLKVFKLKKTPTLADATLWNPYGAEGADPGWKKFICVEPAAISTPAVVAPGEVWCGSQLLGVE
jgi:glucose-6-phosphate 1-epimerase